MVAETLAHDRNLAAEASPAAYARPGPGGRGTYVAGGNRVVNPWAGGAFRGASA
jgi:hypothetical protein